MKYFIILVSFLIINCKSAQYVQNKSLIFLQKTACHGACPIYKATLYSNGKIIYRGEKFTPYIGEIETQLSQKDLMHLINEFEKIQFGQYSSHYVNDKISDVPSIIIQYKEKQIIMRGFEVPSKLTALISKTEKMIERTLND